MEGSSAEDRHVSNASDLRRVEHDVAQILARSRTQPEVYDAALATIGESLGWKLGAVWEVDPEDGRLRCVRTWHAGDEAKEFETLTAVIGFGIATPRRSRAKVIAVAGSWGLVCAGSILAAGSDR